MEMLKNTKENIKIVKILKKISETKWVGNTRFDNIDFCLRSINLQTNNSGHYNPYPIKLSGLKGIYMLNQDGSLWFEHRIIKENNHYKIETLSNSGYGEFENLYSK